MNYSNNANLAAIVVSFFPEDAVIDRLLKSLSSQVGHLILVDNGGGENAAAAIREQGVEIEYIRFGKNLGLGHALNAGFERAASLGVKYVATFDQDSDPPADLVGNLMKFHEELELKGVNCAAVGPVFFDRREAVKVYFPFYFEKNGLINSAVRGMWPDDLVETDSLITSGMLVRTDVWVDGIHYDDGLFVDYTDTEWCFRVRAKGYKLYGCIQIEMGHAPSDAPPARVFGLSFFRYSPLRRFYYFRNTVKFCLAPYVSWAWRRRLALGLALRFFINLVIDKKKFFSLKMMLKGAYDGLCGKSGEFSK
jgi:rhamnosyltransferase